MAWAPLHCDIKIKSLVEMELIQHCICRQNSCNKRECAPWLLFIFQMFPLKSWGQQQQEGRRTHQTLMGEGRMKSEVKGEQKKWKDGIALGNKYRINARLRLLQIITAVLGFSPFFTSPVQVIPCLQLEQAPVGTSEPEMPVNIAQLGVLKSQIPPQPSLHGEDKHTAI